MNQTRSVALDFEGVCGDAMTAIKNHMEMDGDINQDSWGFEPHIEEEFRAAGEILFGDHVESIEPYDENIGELVDLLRESHEVEILTNRHGHDESIQFWLEKHGIEVDGFRSNPGGTDKSGFEKSSTNPDGFTAFIDDKPTLAYNVELLFLVDQPWNQHIEADNEAVIRVGENGVGALRDVLNEMYDGPIRD